MEQSPDRKLAALLEDKSRVLSLRCIEGMYEDPFWQVRFGERGRQHAEADSAYHVKYVAAALREDDLGTFRRYAVWLRGVLAARGMCSFHLTESFRQLTNAIHAESIDGAPRAAAVLAEGARALTYDEGAAGELDAQRAEIGERTRAAVSAGPAYRVEELLSFLADALARADADSFRRHVAFLSGSLVSGDGERRMLEATLNALRATVPSAMSEHGAKQALAVLDTATLAP